MSIWTGKIAIVTGASSGIGAAIAVALAKVGFNVVGLARRTHLIEELSTELPNFSGKIHARHCDVASIESIQQAFAWIEQTFGQVHVLINNAGRTRIGLTLEAALKDEEIITTINTNLTGLVICTREAHKLMERHQDPAYIININSIQGHISPNPTFALGNLYGSTKHAVKNLTEVIRTDLAAADCKRIRISVS